MGLHRRLFGENPQKTAKRRHRAIPTIEAKYEFVQIGLQIFGAHPVVNSVEPFPHIFKHAMNMLAIFRAGSRSRGTRIDRLRRAPQITARRHIHRQKVFDVVASRRGHDLQAQLSHHLLSFFVFDDFDGPHDRCPLGRFDHSIAPNSPKRAADFVKPPFNDTFKGFALALDHRQPKAVQKEPCASHLSDPQLPLQLYGAHSGRMSRNQVSRPKPSANRQMGSMHQGVGEGGNLATATRALKSAAAFYPPSSAVPAARANKSIGPSALHEIVETNVVAMKDSGEFQNIFRITELTHSRVG